MDVDWRDQGESSEKVLRRAHATYLRLHSEIRVAEDREAAAREHLVEAQRQADELVGRAMPVVERITAAILAEADGEAATILAAGEAAARDLTSAAREADHQVLNEVRRTLEQGRRTERQQVAEALSESQRRLNVFLETATAAEASAPPLVRPTLTTPPARHPPATGTDDEWLAELRNAVNALESLEPDSSERETFGA